MKPPSTPPAADRPAIHAEDLTVVLGAVPVLRGVAVLFQSLALGKRDIGVQGHHRTIGRHLRVRMQPIQAERPAAHEHQLLQPR